MSRALIAHIFLFAALAGGCCCPPRLSCRYGEPGCGAPPPVAMAGSCVSGNSGCAPGVCGEHCDCGTGDCEASRGVSGHRPLLAHHHRMGLNQQERVPSQQHADYVSPLPEYHPVPTRPVFEPLPTYPPPHLLDPPAKMHPMLHPHGE